MIAEMGLKHVSEDLKQGITVKSAKIHRYENRNNFIKSTEQSKFYTELSEDKICPDLKPDSEEAKQFWESIWSAT